MESDWRWNVTAVGMQDSDWQLCARLVDDTITDWYLVQRRGSPFLWIYQCSLFSSLPVFVFRTLIAAGPPNFPYGFDVFPD